MTIEVTEERAREIVIEALQLCGKLTTDPHMSDDGLDYIEAAVTNAADLLEGYIDSNELAVVNEWLNQPTDHWGGCDGELRYDLPETKGLTN